jgi:hypothetical protein
MIIYGLQHNQGKRISITEAQLHSLILEAMSLDDIYAKYYSKIPKEDFFTLVKTDPTYDESKPQKMGIYTKWIIAQYKRGNFIAEDAYKLKDALYVFHKFNSQMEIKDINKFKNPSDLYDVTDPYQDKKSNSELEAIAKKGAERLYEDKEWLIISPLTYEASLYYGKGTRWCTASNHDATWFENYMRQGKLYINIRKQDGAKFQFHFESESFMDSSDNPIGGEVAYEIGLSQGAIDFYYSLGDEYGEEITEERESEEEEETEVYTNDGWRITREADYGGFLYIYSPNGNIYTYNTDESDGCVTAQDEYYTDPMYHFLPSHVIRELESYMESDDFLQDLIGLDNLDDGVQGLGFIDCGNYILHFNVEGGTKLFKKENETFETYLIKNFDEDGMYATNDLINYIRGNLDKLESNIPLYSRKDELMYIFNRYHETYLNEHGARKILNIQEGSVSLKTDDGALIVFHNDRAIGEECLINVPNEYDGISMMYFLDGYDLLAVNVGDENEYIYYMYSLDEKRYVNTKEYLTFSNLKNAIGGITKEEYSQKISMQFGREDPYYSLFMKLGSFLLTSPYSDSQVFLMDGRILTKLDYLREFGYFDDVVNFWKENKK